MVIKFIGTLQAGYTDFHYLRPIWRETTRKDALIGVGMTGIGSGAVLPYDLYEASQQVIAENIRVAKLLDINPAAELLKDSDFTGYVTNVTISIPETEEK